MRVAVLPLNAGSRQQLCGLLHVLDEFLFLASLSKSLVPKDHAEVCAIARAVILTRVTGRNGYPDHYDQALAFSAILYPASRELPLRSAFLDFNELRRRSGLPRSAFIPERVRSRLSAGGASSASGDLPAPELGHLPFGPSVTASCACCS
jgi:hypothetical protein